MNQATAASLSRSCQPWCTDHINATPANQWPQDEDQICQNDVQTPDYGGLSLSYTVAHGPMVTLYNTRDDLTLAQAEQLALALLMQVAAARAGGAR